MIEVDLTGKGILIFADGGFTFYPTFYPRPKNKDGS